MIRCRCNLLSNFSLLLAGSFAGFACQSFDALLKLDFDHDDGGEKQISKNFRRNIKQGKQVHHYMQTPYYTLRLTNLTCTYFSEVRELQFSPHRETLCAVALGNNIEIIDWNLNGSGTTLNALLQRHGNSITDLSWHEQDSNMIVTSANDYYVFIWVSFRVDQNL